MRSVNLEILFALPFHGFGFKQDLVYEFVRPHNLLHLGRVSCLQCKPLIVDLTSLGTWTPAGAIFPFHFNGPLRYAH